MADYATNHCLSHRVANTRERVDLCTENYDKATAGLSGISFERDPQAKRVRSLLRWTDYSQKSKAQY
ncbi:hypothetical protein KUH03_41275 [Sphingobacterium sp. E70]|uniref:hypothetical protein n=1 Tax=Sphingobacterium sp. E70 TaxID=2853439 RepID=UPI00211CABED|nr:hypothetical protein [Sphingobacterium sp. E70]ULT25190.1 hypothetical protein KUH03_41275 [Sphingobacterium sp. E70]